MRWLFPAMVVILATVRPVFAETFTLPEKRQPEAVAAPAGNGLEISDPNPVLEPWNGQEWEYLTAHLFSSDSVLIGSKVVTFKYIGLHGWELVGVDAGNAYFKRQAVTR